MREGMYRPEINRDNQSQPPVDIGRSFLQESYVPGEHNTDNALISDGFQGYSPQSRIPESHAESSYSSPQYSTAESHANYYLTSDGFQYSSPQSHIAESRTNDALVSDGFYSSSHEQHQYEQHQYEQHLESYNNAGRLIDLQDRMQSLDHEQQLIETRLSKFQSPNEANNTPSERAGTLSRMKNKLGDLRDTMREEKTKQKLMQRLSEIVEAKSVLNTDIKSMQQALGHSG